jgi:hypothetical protein
MLLACSLAALHRAWLVGLVNCSCVRKAGMHPSLAAEQQGHMPCIRPAFKHLPCDA